MAAADRRHGRRAGRDVYPCRGTDRYDDWLASARLTRRAACEFVQFDGRILIQRRMSWGTRLLRCRSQCGSVQLRQRRILFHSWRQSQLRMNQGNSIREQLTELFLGPALDQKLRYDVQIRPWIDVVRNASAYDG